MIDKRWCFANDDNAHSYLIPAEMRPKFHEMLGHVEKDDGEEFDATFGKYRCVWHPGRYTFTDPKADP